MNAFSPIVLLAPLLFVTAAHAQTDAEEEQLIFIEVAERSVQVPASFAGVVCGRAADEVVAEFGDGVDPACSLDQSAAAQMGLTDENGELVDLTLQEFVSVQLPDGETRVQMPMGFATRLCGLDESALADDPMTERQVACELTQEQMDASNMPGLGARQAEGSATSDTQGEAPSAETGGTSDQGADVEGAATGNGGG